MNERQIMRVMLGGMKTVEAGLERIRYAQRIGPRLGVTWFPWQLDALRPWKRMLLLCARQAGKSFLIGLMIAHTARFIPGSLIPIICPAKHQSRLVMDKVRAVIQADPTYPKLSHEAMFEIETENGSRIVALPGTERSVRGPSGPALLVIDEAGRVRDQTYRAARPMMLGAGTQLVISSTAWGKRGFFYDIADRGDPKLWHRTLVRSPWDVENDQLIKHAEEAAFREQWRKRGWNAWYSDRHAGDPAFVAEEALEGKLWYDQEHACRFLNVGGSMFAMDDLEAMEQADVLPLLRAMTGLQADDEAGDPMFSDDVAMIEDL